VMSQIFGSGQYSSLPQHTSDLAGNWNITSRGPGMGNSYISLIPYQTGTIGSSALANVTDLMVTDMGSPSLRGYVSLVLPGNYIIYTPFPSTVFSTPGLMPVAAVGLQLDVNTISMINIPNGFQSYWTRMQGITASNVAMSNAVLMANNNIPMQVTPGSPAGIATHLGITPQKIQNAQTAAATITTNQTIPAQMAFTQNPIPTSSSLMGYNGITGTTMNTASQLFSLPPKGPSPAIAAAAAMRRSHGGELVKQRYHPRCSCPDCHRYRTAKGK